MQQGNGAGAVFRQIGVHNAKTHVAGRTFHFLQQNGAQQAAMGVRGHEQMRQCYAHGLHFVIARRADKLRPPHDDAILTDGKQHALGHHEQATEIALKHLTPLRL